MVLWVSGLQQPVKKRRMTEDRKNIKAWSGKDKYVYNYKEERSVNTVCMSENLGIDFLKSSLNMSFAVVIYIYIYIDHH